MLARRGVYVAIALAPDLEPAGLAKANIQTDLELKLRLAGIPVLSREEWLTTHGPTLFLSINAMSRRDDNSVWPFYTARTPPRHGPRPRHRPHAVRPVLAVVLSRVCL